VSIYVIWESRFREAQAAEGRAVTEAIWQDMPCFEPRRRILATRAGG